MDPSAGGDALCSPGPDRRRPEIKTDDCVLTANRLGVGVIFDQAGFSKPHGRMVVCHLRVELSRRVRSDGGARRHGRTYLRFAMGPTLRSSLREKMEELR